MTGNPRHIIESNELRSPARPLLLIRDGESVKIVQAGHGHASAPETLDAYRGVWSGNQDRTRLAIDPVFGALARADVNSRVARTR